jgi:hypothetical protein
MKRSKKLQSDIKFAKDVARDYGHNITDAEAIKAVKICKDDYYAYKEYFLN